MNIDNPWNFQLPNSLSCTFWAMSTSSNIAVPAAAKASAIGTIWSDSPMLRLRKNNCADRLGRRSDKVRKNGMNHDNSKTNCDKLGEHYVNVPWLKTLVLALQSALKQVAFNPLHSIRCTDNM